MLVFDPFLLLFWIFLSSFLPGAIFSVSLLKKTSFNLLEKVLIGFGIGLVLPQLVPILLLLVGIKYSFGIAIAGIVFFYLMAIALFIKEKPFELKLPEIGSLDVFLKQNTVNIILVLVLLLTFWLRLQSYSPVFQELDPYFYDYSPQQILTQGYNQFNDKTAWYPDLETSHRTQPILSYMEAVWYSLYTGGVGYSNMLLATIASVYPPIVTVFSIFFLYLLFTSQYKREHALIAATIASFVPIFLMKTAGGEPEIQPYAFLALPFFFAAYAFSVREKELKEAIPYLLLTLIGTIAVFMGSSSTSVVFAALLIFIPLQSIALFLKNDERLKSFSFINIAVCLGIYIIMSINNVFMAEHPGVNAFFPSTTLLVAFILSVFPYALYYLQNTVKDKELRLYSVMGVIVIALLIFAFTPVKDIVSNFALGTLQVAKYTKPLHRTIAEQGTTGTMFQSMLGFMAASPEEVASSLIPIPAISGVLGSIISVLFLPFSMLTNLFFQILISILNGLFGAGIVYEEKANSLLLVLIALEIIAIIVSLVRFSKKDNLTLALLFLAIIIPPAIVGILKTKYVIYIGFFFAGAFAMVLGEGEIGLAWLARKVLDGENLKKAVYTIPIILLLSGSVFAYLQYSHDGLAPALLANSLKTRFQDNPMAQKSNFEKLCEQTKLGGSPDADVCSAASDPMAYANKGTNYQYSTKLCVYSLASDPYNIKNDEMLAISFRCQRITEYWIESMEWIRYDTEDTSRTTSWWDYGHWINFFGQKNTVLRNEHASSEMIGEVAHVYTDGTPEELIEFMKSHDSKYALFDVELLMGGNNMGGKYGALNYLSCASSGETSVNSNPGSSLCEVNHLWETVYLQKTGQYAQTCTISMISGKSGMVGYAADYVVDPTAGTQTKLTPKYCLGEVTLANGQKTFGTYYLNQKYPNGDLKLNKALLKTEYDNEDAAAFTAFYTYDKIWIENGQIKDGYEDRKGKFYDSNLYKGFFLKEIPGFDLVFESANGEVKIYKLKE
jgi:asparagine N-glycosylation enzyme membrane subunit Stt3